jgi:SUMO ligase MMS21 Smc5/6 complex component
MRELLQTAAFVHDGSATNQRCPITQDEFAEGDAVLVLPCGHAFFKDAIQAWLEKESAECPVCRHALPSYEVIQITSDAVDAAE